MNIYEALKLKMTGQMTEEEYWQFFESNKYADLNPYI